jgi:prophage maintenance system killer protein
MKTGWDCRRDGIRPVKPSITSSSKNAITTLKSDLAERVEATALFGQERSHSLQGILGNIDQTFGGQDLCPSVEEKTAHLLHFVIKDHPFSDGKAHRLFSLSDFSAEQSTA